MRTTAKDPSDTRVPSDQASAGYSAALAQAGTLAQKPGRGVPAYTRWVNRPLAKFVVAGAYVLKFTPNMVTTLSALCSALAITILLLADPAWGVGLVVGSLFAVGYVLDSADGQLARLQGSGGIAGEWLDHVVDAIRTPAIHLAVMVAAFVQTSLPLYFAVIPLLFCLTSVGHFMSQILAEKLLSSQAPSRPKTDDTSGGGGRVRSWVSLPSDTGVLCWMFVLWGDPDIFVVGYGILFLTNFVIASLSIRGKFRRLQQAQHKQRV